MTGPLLVPLTREARAAVGKRAAIAIDRFPFRIGRALPAVSTTGGDGVPENDLYIPDVNRGLQVSPAHLQIVRGPDGEFAVEERGSAFGTIVGGRMLYKPVGRLRCALADGDVIVIGQADSGFVFRFHANGLPSGPIARLLRLLRRTPNQAPRVATPAASATPVAAHSVPVAAHSVPPATTRTARPARASPPKGRHLVGK